MINSRRRIGGAAVVWLALWILAGAVHGETAVLSGEAPVVSGVLTPPLVLDYYVSIFGSDSNDGLTPNSPLATIQEAVNRAKGGATIHVGFGEYFVCDLVISNTLHFKGDTKDAEIRCNVGYLESVIFYVVGGAEGTTFENSIRALR